MSPNPADQIPMSIKDRQDPKQPLDTNDSVDWMQNFALRYAHYGIIIDTDNTFSDRYIVDLYEGGYADTPTRTQLTAHAMSAADTFEPGDRVDVYLTQDDIGCWIRHPQIPDVFVVVCTGLDGASDFVDNYYWMARAYLANKDAGFPHIYLPYDATSPHYRIIPVCNLFENNCKTHFVRPGTWAHVWWDWDQQNPPAKRWFTDVLDEGTCGNDPCSASTSNSNSGSSSGGCCPCYVITINGVQNILLRNGNAYFSDGYTLEQTDSDYWLLSKSDGSEVYYCYGPCPAMSSLDWLVESGTGQITDVHCCDSSTTGSSAGCCPAGFKIVTVLVSPVTQDEDGNTIFTIQDVCVPDCPPNTRVISIPCCNTTTYSDSSSGSSSGSSSSSSSGSGSGSSVACVKCGDCSWSPSASISVTWSFSIDDSTVALDGSGRTWAEYKDPSGGYPTFATAFTDIATGTETLTPADLTEITGGGTTGYISWGKSVTVGSGTYTLLCSYNCATSDWGFAIYGPLDGTRLTHTASSLDSAHPIGNMSGTCAGASGTNSVYTSTSTGVSGFGPAEYLATGTISISVTENTCG